MNNIHPSATVAKSAFVDPTAKVWNNAQVRENAVLEADCIVGAGAYIGTGVRLGKGTKVQNYALIYEPAQIGTGVFIGPAVVLTNDHNPRATNGDGTSKSATDWDAVEVIVEDGASIGARSVCVAPVRIGTWALVGAGSVVTRDVLPYSLVMGNPARHVAWVGEAGYRLIEETSNTFVCPKTGERYLLEGHILTKCG